MPKRRTKTFTANVLGVVAKIPKGKTLTYKEVAGRAGNPKAARAVGAILHSYDAKKYRIPCHRVVCSDGKIGGYRWGTTKKVAILKREALYRRK